MFSVFFCEKLKKVLKKGVDICVVMVYNVVTKPRKEVNENDKKVLC